MSPAAMIIPFTGKFLFQNKFNVAPKIKVQAGFRVNPGNLHPEQVIFGNVLRS